MYSRSVESYSKRGKPRFLYMCVKLTKVSKDLFYFYLLAGEYTETHTHARTHARTQAGTHIHTGTHTHTHTIK